MEQNRISYEATSRHWRWVSSVPSPVNLSNFLGSKLEGDYRGLVVSLHAGVMFTWKQPRMSPSPGPGVAGPKLLKLRSRARGYSPAGQMLAVQT